MSHTLHQALIALGARLQYEGNRVYLTLPSNNEELASLFHFLSDLFLYQSDFLYLYDTDAPGLCVALKPGNTWCHLEEALNVE